MFVLFPAFYCSLGGEQVFSYRILVSKATPVTNSGLLVLCNIVGFVCFLTFMIILQDLHSLLDMYSPGMLVRCIVTSVEKSADGRRSIKLSINPKNVNKGLHASALTSGMVSSGSAAASLGFGGAS